MIWRSNHLIPYPADTLSLLFLDEQVTELDAPVMALYPDVALTVQQAGVLLAELVDETFLEPGAPFGVWYAAPAFGGAN